MRLRIIARYFAYGFGLMAGSGRFGSSVGVGLGLGSAAGAYLGGLLWAAGLARAELCIVLALPAVGAAIVMRFLARRNLGAPVAAMQVPAE